MNADVLTASHYAAAREHLGSTPLDLAYIDLELPTESGFELCEYIRRGLGLKTLPILVTSQRGGPEEMAYAEAAGANLFLKKPFAISVLCAHIGALLRQAEEGTSGPPSSRSSFRRLYSKRKTVNAVLGRGTR
jgi:DNA-binding response OmpR family regulator